MVKVAVVLMVRRVTLVENKGLVAIMVAWHAHEMFPLMSEQTKKPSGEIWA